MLRQSRLYRVGAHACVRTLMHTPLRTQRESGLQKSKNQPGGLRPSKSKGHVCIFSHLGLYLDLRCNSLYRNRGERANLSLCQKYVRVLKQIHPRQALPRGCCLLCVWWEAAGGSFFLPVIWMWENSYGEDEAVRPKSEAVKPSSVSRRSSQRLEVEGCRITCLCGLNVAAKAV